MAKERIDIVIPEAELARNDEKKERLARTRQFERTDRVPAIVNANQWTQLAGRRCTFAEYIRSPRDNLRGQILNYRWRVENIHDDLPIATDTLTIEPDLGCLRGMEFPLEITWLEDGPPKSQHLLTEPEQIDELAVPEPTDGVNGKRIEWYRAMCGLAEDFDVRINGQPLKIETTLTQPGGPIPSAFALAGANLFLWMLMDPDRVHRLMDVVTQSHMQCLAYADELTGRNPVHPVLLGADTAELIGPDTFREFVVPYYLRIWETYSGSRPFHMCGKVDHLLDILRDELGITYLDGFGFPVDRHLLAQKMAGRVLLRGGMDPVLLKEGPHESIISESMDYVGTVGCKGGFILSIGGGAAPGTPVENLNAIVEASRRVGCPVG